MLPGWSGGLSLYTWSAAYDCTWALWQAYRTLQIFDMLPDAKGDLVRLRLRV